MEKNKIVDSILEAIHDEVTQFVEFQDTFTIAIEYEEPLLHIGQMFTYGLLTKSSGEVVKSKNSKKSSYMCR